MNTLSGLRAALRTERDVRLAVLFGSTATGDDGAGSDVDLLIVHRRDDHGILPSLRRRLGDALGKPVHLVLLDDARRSPSLLADIVQEGRVVVDRGGLWPELVERRQDLFAAAAREDRATLVAAAAVVESARGRLRA